jgi:hypothetical protein
MSMRVPSVMYPVCTGVRVGGRAEMWEVALGRLLEVRLRKAVRMWEAEDLLSGVRGGICPGEEGIRKSCSCSL